MTSFLRARDASGIRVQNPPPSEDATLGEWQRQIADTLNRLPNLSIFSAQHPNSEVTAQAPALGFNITSSNTSVLWAKQVGSGNTGWVPLA